MKSHHTKIMKIVGKKLADSSATNCLLLRSDFDKLVVYSAEKDPDDGIRFFWDDDDILMSIGMWHHHYDELLDSHTVTPESAASDIVLDIEEFVSNRACVVLGFDGEDLIGAISMDAESLEPSSLKRELEDTPGAKVTRAVIQFWDEKLNRTIRF